MHETSRVAERSITLAAVAGEGLVRTCPSGCVHVTYGCVTLDFARAASFQRLAAMVAEHPVQPGETQIRYGHAILRFTPDRFEEFRDLVGTAAQRLEELSVVRRLLAGLPECGLPECGLPES